MEENKNVYKDTITSFRSNIRDDFAADLKDMKRLLKKHGIYTPAVREVLIKKLNAELEAHPEIYAKGGGKVEK